MTRLLESLESRTLLAGVAGFSEADGDLVSIQLSGPGTLTVTPGVQPSLNVTGSDLTSELRIILVSQGLGSDGRVHWGQVRSTQLKLFSAPQVDFNANSAATDVVFSGTVKDVVVGDLSGGEFKIHFTSVESPRPAEKTNFTARVIDRTHVQCGGWFDQFTASNITGPSDVIGAFIQALKIRTLRVNNSFADRGAAFSIFGLRDPIIHSVITNTEFGVQTLVVVGGVSGGQWQIPGPVRSMQLGGVADGNDSFTSNGVQPEGDLDVSVVGHLSLVHADRDLRGLWSAVSFGTFIADDDVDVNIHTFEDGGIDSIRGEEVNLLSGFDGGIKQIVARSALHGHTFAGYIDSILVTGGVRGPGNCDFGFTLGLDPLSGHPLVAHTFRLGTMTVAGTWLNAVGFVQKGDVKSIDVGGMNNVAIEAGVPFGSILPNQDFGTVSQGTFNAALGGTIKSLRVRAAAGDPAVFTNSWVIARNIQNIRFDGRINTANGGTSFGVKVAAPPVTLKIRFNSLTFTSTNLLSISNTDFLYQVV